MSQKGRALTVMKLVIGCLLLGEHRTLAYRLFEGQKSAKKSHSGVMAWPSFFDGKTLILVELPSCLFSKNMHSDILTTGNNSQPQQIRGLGNNNYDGYITTYCNALSYKW